MRGGAGRTVFAAFGHEKSPTIAKVDDAGTRPSIFADLFRYVRDIYLHRVRSRANVAHIRQSSPDYGLGFQAEVLKTF